MSRYRSHSHRSAIAVTVTKFGRNVFKQGLSAKLHGDVSGGDQKSVPDRSKLGINRRRIMRHAKGARTLKYLWVNVEVSWFFHPYAIRLCDWCLRPQVTSE